MSDNLPRRAARPRAALRNSGRHGNACTTLRDVRRAAARAPDAQAGAQTYPAKPITIVIGYTPGAVSDLTARTIADGLHQAWGQTVIVDNRPGSGGNLGAAYVARSPGDGYTLMAGTDAQMASNTHLYKHAARSGERFRAGRLRGCEHHLSRGELRTADQVRR